MFFIGLAIFIVYVYFLLRIISRQHRIQRKEHANAYDQVDLDGMGNQGHTYGCNGLSLEEKKNLISFLKSH